MDEICQAWAANEKVDLTIDYFSTQGSKLQLTIAVESQARSGHDIMDFSAWEPAQYANALEPVDDVMGEVLARNGPVTGVIDYLAKPGGQWLVVPGIRGTLLLCSCSRFDLLKQHAGIDILAMYPAGAEPTKAADGWTWDAFLTAAEQCKQAGYPFGLPLGATTDSIDWVGPLFHAYGADLVDANGKLTVKSDAVRQVLDYSKRLAALLPPDVSAWDNSSNNKWLISGKGALIFNPPSAWAVAKRDAPQVAEKLWTHAMPKGPRGRFVAMLPRFQGLWNFSKNKSAAKSLMLHVSSRGRGKIGRRMSGLRSAAVRQIQRLQHLGRGRPTEGDPVALSQQRRPGSDDTRSAGLAADRRADLQPGRHAEDDPQGRARRSDGKDAGLGRERGRGLHAHLRPRATGPDETS
jgi:ABC-type glycerol-3-phosphate transport system substrate-binding protein